MESFFLLCYNANNYSLKRKIGFMKLNPNLQISKKGVNLVRTIIDENNCFFHEILHDNDLGIDGIIELSRNGEINGKSVAVQIKTGSSYINKANTFCSFPIGSHETYWLSHSLPVYGLVCDLDKQCVYFVDIKDHLNSMGNFDANLTNSITFEICFSNTFDIKSYCNIFSNYIFGITPFLPQVDAMNLVSSSSQKDKRLGLIILRKYYQGESSTWEVIMNVFRHDPDWSFRIFALDCLSVGTSNPDLFHSGDDYDLCHKLAKSQITKCDFTDIVLLLECVDDENGFSRGSLGEVVDFVIRNIPDRIDFLCDIISTQNQVLKIRENALFLLACYSPSVFYSIANDVKLPICESLLKYLDKYGRLAPYL
jgi:hypothetical protein